MKILTIICLTQDFKELHDGNEGKKYRFKTFDDLKNKFELQMMLDNPLERWTYILDYKKILEFVFIEEK